MLAGFGIAEAQESKFRVAEFYQDLQDLTAQEENRDDGDGALYAVIKVTSDNEDDDLSQFAFDFNYMKCIMEMRDGELWLFVQRNAKNVTIRREGYRSLKYSLTETIQAGKTYRMKLSMQDRVVQQRILQFKVTPANENAIVKVKKEGTNDNYQLWGTVDASGCIDKLLDTGEYLYEIWTDNNKAAIGKVSLTHGNNNYIENVILTPNFAVTTIIELNDAEIFINGTSKGKGCWTGPLRAGTYNIECRLPNHVSSQKQIVVNPNVNETFIIEKPTRIEGSLFIKSNPTGAKIILDGKNLGVTTPTKIDNVLIGSHKVEIMLDKYNPEIADINVNKDEVATVDVKLSDVKANAVINSNDRTFTVGNVTFKMKLVEAGTFQLGSKYSAKDSVHSVTISQNYYIGETEVTQALWKTVTGYSPTPEGCAWSSTYGLGDNYPAYYISYEDVKKFIKKLNKMTGENFRMPTEAEWEYAARGGNKSKGYTYSGSYRIDDVAWYKDNSSSKTNIVKTKAANELGIYDMSGNVYEWCSDWNGIFCSGSQTDPTGPTTGTYRVARGGSWYTTSLFCDCYERFFKFEPSFRKNDLGFRLALE